jgi:hypothetical protein
VSAAYELAARARLVWEWIWRSRALDAARRAAAEAEPARELWRRARLAAELAERALEPDVPLADGPAHVLAISLYREAAYWALTVRQRNEALDAPSLGELLSADTEGLRVTGLSEADLARVRAVLAEQTFVERAAIEHSRQIADAELSRRFVNALLEESGAASAPRQAVARVHRQRALRMLAILLVAAVVMSCGWLAIARAFRGPDLALGKTWSISREWARCHPEWRKCGDQHTRVFFHTKRHNQPWFLLDLGPGTTVGRVEIENRDDCCQDQAVPLVVEVSDDKRNFREIARRTTPFWTWRATFPPLQARFVRLRVDGRTYFHLSRVSVHRR